MWCYNQPKLYRTRHWNSTAYLKICFNCDNSNQVFVSMENHRNTARKTSLFYLKDDNVHTGDTVSLHDIFTLFVYFMADFTCFLKKNVLKITSHFKWKTYFLNKTLLNQRDNLHLKKVEQIGALRNQRLRSETPSSWHTNVKQSAIDS